MEQGLTKEQLIKMGAKPVSIPVSNTVPTVQKAQGLTKEQLVKMGAKPKTLPLVSPEKTTGEKVSNTLGALFGGKTIGEAIGTSAARAKTRSGEGIMAVDYSKLTPEAIARLEAKGVPTSRQAQLEETAQTIKGPTAGQIVGDVAATGLGLVGMKGLPALAKGASIAQRATRAAKIVGTGAGIGAARSAEEGESLGKGALIGAATAGVFPAVGGVLKFTGKIGGRLGRGLASAISGKKLQVIDEIIANPREALIGLRSIPDDLLSENATLIRKTVARKAKEAGDEFAKALSELPEVSSKKILGTLGVKQKLTKKLREFGVNVDSKKMELDFLESPFDEAESNRLTEVFSVVRNWKDTSPKGIYMLSRKIRNFRKPGEQSPELNSVIDGLSRGVNEYLGERVPASKQMLARFSQAQDIIDAFDQELATKGKFIGGTSERIGTGRKLSQIFAGEKGEAQKLLRNELPGVIPQEAGRQMVAAEAGMGAGSPGLVRNEFIRAITSAIISPKEVGEILVRVGQTKEVADKIANTISQLSPAARTALVRLLSGAQ